jgi:hypothetical protein
MLSVWLHPGNYGGGGGSRILKHGGQSSISLTQIGQYQNNSI